MSNLYHHYITTFKFVHLDPKIISLFLLRNEDDLCLCSLQKLQICFQKSHCGVHLYAESLRVWLMREIMTRIVKTVYKGYTLMTMRRKGINLWLDTKTTLVATSKKKRDRKNKDIVYS